MKTPTCPLFARVLLSIVLLAAAVGLAPARDVHAADQTVTSIADSGPGSLRQAILNVGPGGTITFDLPHYPATITLSSGELTIGKSLTITGPGRGALTISADNNSRVFRVTAGTVTLSDLTIAEGRTTGTSAEGGGIRNASILNLYRIALIGNSALGASGGGAAAGGGIANYYTLTIEDSYVGHNTALAGSGALDPAGASAHGGGIANMVGGWLTLKDTTLDGNQARGSGAPGFGGPALGGGIYGEQDSLQILADCSLRNNTARGGDGQGQSGGAAAGGAIYSKGDLAVTRCHLASNTVQAGDGLLAGYGHGGPIYNDGTASVDDSALSSNQVLGGEGTGGGSGGWAYGGALFNTTNSTSLTVEGTTISNNVAKAGQHQTTIAGRAFGGGFCSSTDPDDASLTTLVNSTFSGNRALSEDESQGGGLRVGAGAEVKLSFCTIANNSADKGGGIYSDTTFDNTGPLIKNTIIGANTADTGPHIYRRLQSRGYNLIEDLTDGVLDTSGGGNTNQGNIFLVDPKLGPLQDNGGPELLTGGAPHTQAPWGGEDPSSAINAGSSTDIDGNAVNTDQRGVTRPLGGDPDMGALEWAPANLVLTKIVTPAFAEPLEVITFTLTITNNGTIRATGILLTDTMAEDLGDLTTLEGTLLITEIAAGPPLVWQVQDLVPGESGTVTYRAPVAEGIAAGRVNTNTAGISTTEPESSYADNDDWASITILNAPPIAYGDNYKTVPDTLLEIAAPGVLSNDIDSNGDALVAFKDSDPIEGTLTLQADGAFTYLPPPGFVGIIKFSYHAHDGTSSSALATVRIAVGIDFVYLPLVLRNH
jgi:uncharacterized repeat protein (TIGR01451 family)